MREKDDPTRYLFNACACDLPPPKGVDRNGAHYFSYLLTLCILFEVDIVFILPAVEPIRLNQLTIEQAIKKYMYAIKFLSNISKPSVITYKEPLKSCTNNNIENLQHHLYIVHLCQSFTSNIH